MKDAVQMVKDVRRARINKLAANCGDFEISKEFLALLNDNKTKGE